MVAVSGAALIFGQGADAATQGQQGGISIGSVQISLTKSPRVQISARAASNQTYYCVVSDGDTLLALKLADGRTLASSPSNACSGGQAVDLPSRQSGTVVVIASPT